MKKQPIVRDGAPRRLSDFFKPRPRGPGPVTAPQNERTTHPEPAKPAANLIDVLASSTTSTGSEIPRSSSGSKTPKTTSTSKRTRDISHDSSDEPGDDGDDEDCIIVDARPIKSPRTSPGPSTSRPLASRKANHFSTPSMASSSIQEDVASPTPASDQTPSVAAVKAGGSFSTNVTATSSFAPSSFTTSSQRVIRNGTTVAVRNSDDEGSNDSFEDLDDIMGPPKPTVQPSSSSLTELTRSPSPPPAHSAKPRSPRSTRNNLLTSYLIKVPDRRLKFNLTALTEMARKEREIDLQLIETVKQISTLDDASGLQGQSREINLEELVQNHGPEEGKERFMEALSRTEALHSAKAWFFFDYTAFGMHRIFEEDPIQAITALEDPSLGPLVQSPRALQNTINTGLLLRSAEAGEISREFAQLLFRLAIQDTREDIRSGCFDVLSVVDSTFITAEVITETFIILGAFPKALDVQHTIEPIIKPSESHSHTKMGWEYFTGLLKVVQICSEFWSDTGREQVLLILLRMSVDDLIVNDDSHRSPLVVAIQALLAGFKSFNQGLLQRIYDQTSINRFRLRILNILSVGNSKSCLLRRRLSLAWFFEDPNHLIQDLKEDHGEFSSDALQTNFMDVQTILTHIQSHPELFTINRDTNYFILKEKTQLLSIGFGNGGSVEHSDEKSFNAGVDRLADTIKAIYGDIIDGGASHASRIEAKDMLDTFVSRLLYSVRTRPRPRKDILGQVLSEDDPRMGQRSLKQFLANARRADATKESTNKRMDIDTSTKN